MTTLNKIATCCYCGTRAALVLSGRTRHELSCSACGAPLHDLKVLKADHPGKRELVRPGKSKSYRKPERPKLRKTRKKKKSGFAEWIREEAFDLLDDIFD